MAEVESTYQRALTRPGTPLEHSTGPLKYAGLEWVLPVSVKQAY